jgi:hypothetical protein
MVSLTAQIRRGCRGVAAVTAATADPTERANLAYVGVYACGFAGHGDLSPFRTLNYAVMDTPFLERLARLVPGRRPVPGWTIRHWDERFVYLDFGPIRTFFPRTRFADADLEPGRAVSVDIPVILPGVLPGFVFRQGDRAASGQPLSRLYLNINPHQAPWVLGPLAEQLNAVQQPFEMKVLAHPRAYRRRDAAVVYVPSAELAHAIAVLRAALAAGRLRLGAGVPLLTEEILPGVGLADDPIDVAQGQSHGQWVSHLFLQAAQDCADTARMPHRIAALVDEAGRHPDRPHRRAA